MSNRRGRPSRFVNTVEHRENVLAESGFARVLEEGVTQRAGQEIRIVEELERQNPQARILLDRLMRLEVEDGRASIQVDGALASIQTEELRSPVVAKVVA